MRVVSLLKEHNMTHGIVEGMNSGNMSYDSCDHVSGPNMAQPAMPLLSINSATTTCHVVNAG